MSAPPKLNNASPAAQAGFNSVYSQISRANPGADPRAVTQAALKHLASLGYRVISGKIVTGTEAAAAVRAQQRAQVAPSPHRPPAKKAFGSSPGIWAMGRRLF